MILLLVGAGCAARKTVSPPEPPATGAVHADELIGREVRYRLETQCPGDAPNIKIIVSDGVVTLQGVASSQAAAWRAQAAATAVKGVRAVRNELLVRW
jgi:osmotically-inducible protein OsmY